MNLRFARRKRAKAVGQIAQPGSGLRVGSRVDGVVVSQDFDYRFMRPSDVSNYTPLHLVSIDQKLHVPFNPEPEVSFDTLFTLYLVFLTHPIHPSHTQWPSSRELNSPEQVFMAVAASLFDSVTSEMSGGEAYDPSSHSLSDATVTISDCVRVCFDRVSQPPGKLEWIHTVVVSE